MSDEEIEEVSDSEKLQIAQHFLLSSPPGEFNEVLSDVKNLLPEALLTPEMLQGIARAYNERHTSLVTLDGGKELIPICKAASLDPTHFIDSVNKKRIKVDHLTWTGVTSADKPLPPGTFDASLEGKRTAIVESIGGYLAGHFGGGRAAAGVYSKDGTITVVISGDKINLKNYWSASWISTWTIKDGKCSGQIKLRAHYFEEGNVQLHTTKDLPALDISGSSDTDFAQSVKDCIFAGENALQRALGSMYVNMSDETLKSMRRVMPITRTKFEWNNAAHKMVKNLKIKD